MRFHEYVAKAQFEFDIKMGYAPTAIVIPCWRMDEILNEDAGGVTSDIKEFLYKKEQRINGLNIVWSSAQNYITLR